MAYYGFIKIAELLLKTVETNDPDQGIYKSTEWKPIIGLIKERLKPTSYRFYRLSNWEKVTNDPEIINSIAKTVAKFPRASSGAFNTAEIINSIELVQTKERLDVNIK